VHRPQHIPAALDAGRRPEKSLREAVTAAKIGADSDIPHLSAAQNDECVPDLRLLGLVQARPG
jgi:fatty acid CoA ligase FadD9